ncbi:DUF637 domain-containing protein [Pseudomonas iridis]|uniref:DUF637 domain-containing protein n=1 Tax=Pseudomonas iridis TaxID=2710587 RepID=A0ABW8DD96_9PSED
MDWKLIKEIHDSFKYSSSSLGQGAMLAIIIIVTVLTAGAASAAVGTAAVGSTVAAGLGNVMASAVLTSMASAAAVSTINNKGNIGAIAKDVTSSDSLKNYVAAGVSGGIAGQGIGVRLAVNSALKTVVNGGKF